MFEILNGHQEALFPEVFVLFNLYVLFCSDISLHFLIVEELIDVFVCNEVVEQQT